MLTLAAWAHARGCSLRLVEWVAASASCSRRSGPTLFVTWDRSLGACGLPPASRGVRGCPSLLTTAYYRPLLTTTQPYYYLEGDPVPVVSSNGPTTCLLSPRTTHSLPGRWTSCRPWREGGRGSARRSTRRHTARSRRTTATYQVVSSTWSVVSSTWSVVSSTW